MTLHIMNTTGFDSPYTGVTPFTLNGAIQDLHVYKWEENQVQ